MKIDKNLVCLVTGGASGLGESTVRALIAQGCKVYIADMNTEKGKKMAEELGSNCKFMKVDVSNEENVKALI